MKRVEDSELKEEIKKSFKQDRATERLGKLIELLVNNFASKGTYRGYPMDMRRDAIMMCLRKWRKIDINSDKSAFSYFTTTTERSFWGYIKEYKKKCEVEYRLKISDDGQYYVRDDNEMDGAMLHEQTFTKSRSKKLKRKKENMSMLDDLLGDTIN